jgi:hypothetical protein
MSRGEVLTSWHRDRHEEPGEEHQRRRVGVRPELDRQAAEERKEDRDNENDHPRPAADPEPERGQQRPDQPDRAHRPQAHAISPARIAQSDEQRTEGNAQPVLLAPPHGEDDERHQQDRRRHQPALQVDALPIDREQLRHVAHRVLDPVSWSSLASISAR